MVDDKKPPLSNITVIEHQGEAVNEALHSDKFNLLIDADNNLKRLVNILRENVADKVGYDDASMVTNDEVKDYLDNIDKNLRQSLNRNPEVAQRFATRKSAYESTMNVMKFVVRLTLDNEEITDMQRDSLEINKKNLRKFSFYNDSYKNAFMEVSQLVANSGSQTLETNFSSTFPFPFIEYLESESFKEMQNFTQKILEQEKGASR